MSWCQALVKNMFEGLCFNNYVKQILNMHWSQTDFMQNHKQRIGNTRVGLPLVGEHQTTTVNSLHSWFLKCEYHQGVLWMQGACLVLRSVNVVDETLRPCRDHIRCIGNCHSFPAMMSGSSRQILLNLMWIITELCTGRCTSTRQLSELSAYVTRLLVITVPCSKADPAEHRQFYYTSYCVSW
jgi:hypothetical protein